MQDRAGGVILKKTRRVRVGTGGEGECNVRGGDTIMGSSRAPPHLTSTPDVWILRPAAKPLLVAATKPNLPKATNSQGQSWKNRELRGQKVFGTFSANQIEGI